MFFREKEHVWLSSILLTISILLLILSVLVMMENKSFILEWDILSSSGSTMLFNFYVDWISLLFFSFVALISGSVFFYSYSYMSGDMNYRFFMLMVMMFVVSMFFLVFSLNLVSMMLGWDGLGVVSYILVIYYKNEKSSSAGMLTALSNRVGDAALLLSVACLLEIGSWNYMFMDLMSENFLFWMVSLAAITKSAQIPFSAWLPAAMAAPTPVSALVHSSTLVTAGVYVLIRFSELLKDSLVMSLLIYLGMLTTVMASVTALFEVDFKKVVALSTLSQLGIMVTTLALGFTKLAFIHLLTHAVFKALLFMCSGKVIHSVSNYQDIRKMGGLLFNLPVTGMMMNLSSFALCGIPFLSGFYSKDLIVESVLMIDNFFINYIMFMLIVGLSASYSFRLIYLGIINYSSQDKSSSSNENDWVMLSSKFGLVFMAVTSGCFLIWVTLPVPAFISMMFQLKILALLSMVLGFCLGLVLCLSNYKSLIFMKELNKIYSVMTLWNLPLLSGMALGLMSKAVSSEVKKLDLGWLEIFSGQGFNFMFLQGSEVVIVWLMNSVKGFMVIFFFSYIFFLV